MIPRIETLSEKKLAGKRLKMSFAQNLTLQLWQSFMPARKLITNSLNNFLFSVEIYPDHEFFSNFNPHAPFEKWAAVEVSSFENLPEGMESLTIPSGLYGVFIHKGPASEGQKTYEYIFKEWIPKSSYKLDNRPHFALMGEKYKNNEPDSEEEIWIPIALKNK